MAVPAPKEDMKYEDQEKLKRISVITNPTAGRRQRHRLDAVLNALRDRGCDPSVVATSARGDAEKLARQIDHDQVDVLAVAGGDGTINEVLNGIEAKAPPLAIIPLGTANVLAAEIGLDSAVKAIADTIAFGTPKRISLGLANGRRFAVMASLGLDAEVVRHVSLDLKRFLGKGAYAIETLRQLFAFQAPAYEFAIDGKTQEAFGIIIANGRYFGGRFLVAPNARLDKPSLDVCYATSGGRIAAFRYLASMARGRLADREDYKIIETRSLRVNGPKGMAVQADGDVITQLPAEISVQPDAVTLMFPPGAI